ncbi:HNH endonuclease [Nitratireductor aquimarinus]|nr:HNH endonuclease [Nitratireductor aquimarinus]
MCEGCETAPATEVDHITPMRQGGAPRDRANLQSLCGTCHRQKTGAERAGKTWTPPKHRGCDVNGMPLDPAHPWFMEGDHHSQAIKPIAANAERTATTSK